MSDVRRTFREGFLFYAVLGAVIMGALLLAVPASAQWVDVAPIRQVGNARTAYSDVLSRAPAGGIYGAIQGDREGPIHDVHETTHRINSRVRNSAGPNRNAAYLIGGRACVLVEPRVTLSQVASAVPPQFRFTSFGTYLGKMRAWWDRQPLYILDEWSSYLNGTAVAIELRGSAGSETRTAAACLEFIAYATALLRVVDAADPHYAQRALLEEFIGVAITRSFELSDLASKIAGLGSQEQMAVRQQVVAAYFRSGT
jgi:hypothetical protein